MHVGRARKFTVPKRKVPHVKKHVVNMASNVASIIPEKSDLKGDENLSAKTNGASVFSSSGGMGKAATIMYKHLAHLLSAKQNSPYSLVMGWLRCCLGFSLVHSSVRCLRGSRSTKSLRVSPAFDLAVAEGRLIQP